MPPPPSSVVVDERLVAGAVTSLSGAAADSPASVPGPASPCPGPPGRPPAGGPAAGRRPADEREIPDKSSASPRERAVCRAAHDVGGDAPALGDLGELLQQGRTGQTARAADHQGADVGPRPGEPGRPGVAVRASRSPCGASATSAAPSERRSRSRTPAAPGPLRRRSCTRRRAPPDPSRSSSRGSSTALRMGAATFCPNLVASTLC